MLLELGPGGIDVPGAFTLSYGSFGDPTAVPVTLLDLSLSVPGLVVDGEPTGPTEIRLPAGHVHPLVYDSGTGVIETVDRAGIPLVLENDLGRWRDASLQVGIELDPGGAIVLAQAVAYLPAGIPAASPGASVWLGVGMLAAAALVLARRRAAGV